MKNTLHKIRLARNKKGYTQEYIAFKLNISQKTYNKLENGYTKLTVSRLKKIALILNTDACTLMD